MSDHVSVPEVQMLLGQKDIEIYALQRKVATLEAELLKLRPLPEKKDAPA
jgi:hypothetical protein